MIKFLSKILVVALVITSVFAGTVTGKVTDASSGNGLAGANVMVDGTSLGGAADANGMFHITNVPNGTVTITASMIGYKKMSKTVTISGMVNVNFGLKSSALKLSEVTVEGNFAKDRETPVAFTTIGEDQIKDGFTVQDVPHLFANTPGVYVTSDGGSGMGDSSVKIRGFDEQRIAVMINNVPVNDPESKKVYWSNWGSLPAASQSIQIQRGVGSSLYGSGALGGSINVVTKDAPAEQSLVVNSTAGQYGILKLGVDYNSGLVMGNKSFIGRFNYLEGNGWRDDTFYRGLQYYLSAMVFPDNNNTFKFILHGAPQYHAYSYYGFPAEDFAKYGREWNGHPHVNEDELTAVGPNGRLDWNEDFVDALNGIYDNGEEYTDMLNGIYDEGEDFIDVTNGIYDGDEIFTDIGNGIWDSSEEWTDEQNGIYDIGEFYIDTDDNGAWDPGEMFTDGNGVYDVGESFTDIGDGSWNPGESWIDAVNGIWEDGEAFTDTGNGEWDNGETFVDEANGDYDDGEVFTDSGNGVIASTGRETKLMDVLFMKTDIGNSSQGGLVVGNGRASFDNNVYHKPQFEIHHSYRMSDVTKLTSTFFLSRGYGYGENVNAYYYVNRNGDGAMTMENMFAVRSSSFYQYRSYSDHIQYGLISSLETKVGEHALTAGIEARYWKSRHAGEILNTFGKSTMSYYIGNTKQKFGEGDLYYDYEGIKPQYTMFTHAMWHYGDFSFLTDLQFSYLHYNIVEDVPSSNNYPNHLNPDAFMNGGGIWTGTGEWDHDNDDSTVDVPVEYTLWDYEKDYYFVSPKLGVNYNIDDYLNVFVNWSSAVNEPRVKSFFGYGSPNDALDLEKTEDLEIGLSYDGMTNDGLPIRFKLNWYDIGFEGKAMQIEDPVKANTPGYDYKGRRYIPIGKSTYAGTEIAFETYLMNQLELGVNFSISSNEWGEPVDSEGAQYLYNKDEVNAGIDYEDADGDGKWDAGESALHQNFTDKFGNKTETGMPQLIYGSTLKWHQDLYTLGLAMRHYQDIYVLEDNSKVVVEGHLNADGDWIADKESSTLPAATVFDFYAKFSVPVLQGVDVSVHINNLFDEEYWQKGDKYGFGPGAARTVMLNLGVNI
ncbi:MAG: TonB-dependent receptor [Candidatus Marinimicrobia bacterium]|nr:TonB-dependent receptor [Candidatus Neomarinimicrobiota bacterium]